LSLKRESTELNKSLEKERNATKWWKGQVNIKKDSFAIALAELTNGLKILCEILNTHILDFKENLIRLG